nr:hypothetical protein HmN_000546900 [Hymenolepis microstoma]CUU00375.1 hypothetical transcript [Hymenolepis microstoma]
MISGHMKRILIDFQTIQLKSAIRNAIVNSFHLSDQLNLALKGSLTIEVPGQVNPISLTIYNEGNTNINSKKNLPPSKRKDYVPVTFTGQPSTNCSTILHISCQASNSEGYSSSSLIDGALDLSKGTSGHSSIKEIPANQEGTPGDGITDHFHQNQVRTTSLLIFLSMSALPNMLPATQIESSSVASSPKKRRRVGGTSIGETLKQRQFRCNHCDDAFFLSSVSPNSYPKIT